MKIIIEVRGGVVQEVYCDDPEVAVVLVDWDSEGCSEEEKGIVIVHDENRQEYLVHAAEFSTTPMKQMSRETKAAFEATS